MKDVCVFGSAVLVLDLGPRRCFLTDLALIAFSIC